MEYQDIVKNGQETRVWWQTEMVNGVEKIHARVFDRHYQIRACVRERAKNSGMLKGEDFYTLAKCDNIDEAQNLLEVYKQKVNKKYGEHNWNKTTWATFTIVEKLGLWYADFPQKHVSLFCSTYVDTPKVDRYYTKKSWYAAKKRLLGE